jgi:hypothetical protein
MAGRALKSALGGGVVASVGLFALLPALGSAGCRRSADRKGAVPDENAFEAPALSPERPNAPALAFAFAEEGFGLALPGGCRYREKTVRAPLGERKVSFLSLAENESRALLLVEPTNNGARASVQSTQVDQSGAHVVAEAAPLFDLGAPFLAHDGEHFRGLFTSGPSTGRALVLTRAPHANDARPTRELVAQGDSAGVLDFRCRHDTCAILSTRLGTVATHGLSVLVGVKGAPAAAFRRIDLEQLTAGAAEKDNELDHATEEAATGLAIASLEDTKRLDVVTGTRTAVWVHALLGGADGGVEDTIHGPLPTPFGALDTTLVRVGTPSDEPSTSLGRAVSVAHGSRVDGLCAIPRPLAVLVREGLPTIELPISAPLHSAFVRPLSPEPGAAARGARVGGVLVYSAALRCHDDRRRFVTVQLLDETGAPRGPSMVVGEAKGFAIRTDGADLDLVLLREENVVVARLRCDGG